MHAVEACPSLARQIQSIEFTLTRTFVELFRESSSTVNEYQVNFGSLPAKTQVLIRTASSFFRSLSR